MWTELVKPITCGKRFAIPRLVSGTLSVVVQQQSWFTMYRNWRGHMKFRQLEWLADFIFMLLAFAAGNALYKLHSAGQPLLGVVSESIFAASAVTLLKYI
jgi:hypothetical protein